MTGFRGLLGWLRSVLNRSSNDSERRIDSEPATAAERAVKAPLEELDVGDSSARSGDGRGDGPRTE